MDTNLGKNPANKNAPTAIINLLNELGMDPEAFAAFLESSTDAARAVLKLKIETFGIDKYIREDINLTHAETFTVRLQNEILKFNRHAE